MRPLLILGMGLYAAAEVTATSPINPWTQMGAVAALGAAVLILVSKTIPNMNKENNAAHDKRDAVLREIMLHCSRDKKE